MRARPGAIAVERRLDQPRAILRRAGDERQARDDRRDAVGAALRQRAGEIVGVALEAP